MASVSRGGSITLTVQFFEYVGGPAYDPTETGGQPTLTIKLEGVTQAGPFSYSGGAGAVIRDGVGRYHYVWSVPTNAELGTYSGVWVGTIHGNTVSGTEEFEVVIAGSASTGTGAGTTLGETQELQFMPEPSIIWGDPDEILALFPDAGFVEIFELMYEYTLDAQILLDGSETPTPLAYEFVKAATACSLSRIYDWGGGGDEVSVRLGDLSVTNRAFPKGNVTRANATTWCELAEALRQQLARSKGMAGMKAIVKGSNFVNPMPKRRLARKD